MKRYTTREFSDLTGVPVNTLAKWNYEQRLIPAENPGQGKQAYYSAEQLQADVVINYSPRELTKQDDELVVLSLADRARRINKFIVDTQKNFVSIGNELIAAKAEIPHGGWANWLRDNFDWSQQTANYFMRIAERFTGDKLKYVFQFQPSTLRALSSLPAGEEEKFIAEQAAAGKPVENQSARQVQAAVKQYNLKKSKGTNQKTFSDLKITNPHNDDVYISSKHILEEVAPVIDVDADIVSASNSESTDNPAQDDSPVNETVDDSATVIDNTPPALLDSELDDDIRPIVGVEITKSELETFIFVASIEEVGTLRRLRELIDNRIAALARLGITESNPPAAIAQLNEDSEDEFEEDESVFDKLTLFTQRFNICGEIAIFEDGKLRRIESPKYNTTFYFGDRPFWYVVDTKISSQTVYSEDKFFALLARCGACTIDSPDNSELAAKK